MAPKQKKTKKKSKVAEPKVEPTRRTHEVFGILTLAGALLVGPSLMSVQFGDGDLMGPFGAAVGMGVNWVFGLAGYIVVLGLVTVALRIFGAVLSDQQSPRRTSWRERIGLMMAATFGAVLLHLIFRPDRLAGASYGGAAGELAAELLCAFVSTPGAWILCIAGLALSVVLGTSFSWVRSGLGLYQVVASWTIEAAGRAAERSRSLARFVVTQLASVKRSAGVTTNAGGTAAMPPILRIDLAREDEDDREEIGLYSPPADAMPLDLEIGKESGPPPRPLIGDEDPSMDDDAEQDAPAQASAEQDVDDDADAAEAQTADAARRPKRKRTRSAAAAKDAEETEEQLTIIRPEHRRHETAPADDEPEAKAVQQSDGPGFVLNNDAYRPPPLSLLQIHDSDEASVDKEEIYAQAELLAKTLADYKILGRVTKVHPGPVVTMYEFVPAPGTRISKVANLANDLAMSLKAQRVRIVAPIPGKGAIGIEVPNASREAVSFKEIVTDSSFRNPKIRLGLAIGKNIFGAPVVMDLARMPHLLVAGATGAGKSVSVNAMICSLLLRYSPEEVRLIMVDPKFLELSGYNDIPHLMLPVVTDPKQANIALRWAVAEMERRYQMLAEMRVRDITAYNRKVDKLREGHEGAATTSDAPSKVLVVRKNDDGSEERLAGGEQASESEAPTADDKAEAATTAEKDLPRRLPYIIVIIDEFADLMMIASKEVETSVARLAQKARAAGVHLIIATQRPSVDVITGLIKANFPSRMAFQVASNHDSKTILGSQGAENLLGSGDMLVLDRGTEMKRIHGAYISDEEIRGIIDWLREQGRPVYDMDILKAPEDEEDGSVAEEDHDEMYDQAVQIVAETRQASISYVQRRLRIGYNRSARLVERMEREGIVSAPDGPRGREVLIQQQ